MCSLFGWMNYQGVVPNKVLKKLTQSLAVASEERGTDASGISYVKDGQIVIFKRPKPAHRLHFNSPEGTKAVLGHTRLTTQGNEKNNANNHPFYGKTGATSFSFAHNGIIYNDKELRKEKQLPVTSIETDSYIAVQLLESQHKLDFESLRYMSEQVQGSFTFSLLDDKNTLYLIKGSNPLCLLHFASLGLYVYASTESIMKNALKRVGLHKFGSERIEADEGDIIRIDRNGKITRSRYEPKIYRSKYMSWYDDDLSSYYNMHEEILLAYCGCYGVDSSDVELLLEYGYTCDEIEDMLTDHSLLQEALRDVKYMCGEEVYESYCGAF
ncbi:Glutamine amidotransferase domain-containing protein [Ruminococcus flavefaciens]|uniref:Glutamine amidotransferase domain-containing protein n=1 Tax=Ruminococcus flavefaciens TaxID=1265 RepID=A0A1H6LN11_RUMFL|nr:class II glutamine amidotransferase [Ruminococcus flavefaciens]SEH87706.1 Glutamine amidotransferase domain-containing protein [Ruminococcus flavefaciens]